jgi:hypothetical protein
MMPWWVWPPLVFAACEAVVGSFFLAELCTGGGWQATHSPAATALRLLPFFVLSCALVPLSLVTVPLYLLVLGSYALIRTGVAAIGGRRPAARTDPR